MKQTFIYHQGFLFYFLFVCFGFHVVLKHLRSYHDGACSGTLTNVLPYRNAMPQTQDMTPGPPRHSIHTRGRPAADVECHTGIHSYPF